MTSFSYLQGKVRLYIDLLNMECKDECLNFPDPFVEFLVFLPILEVAKFI